MGGFHQQGKDVEISRNTSESTTPSADSEGSCRVFEDAEANKTIGLSLVFVHHSLPSLASISGEVVKILTHQRYYGPFVCSSDPFPRSASLMASLPFHRRIRQEDLDSTHKDLG
jgi:hypothetical protein